VSMLGTKPDYFNSAYFTLTSTKTSKNILLVILTIKIKSTLFNIQNFKFVVEILKYQLNFTRAQFRLFFFFPREEDLATFVEISLVYLSVGMR